MKKVLLLAAMAFNAIVASAQYWQIPNPNINANPGTLNSDPEYPVGGGIAAGWATVLTGNNSSPTWSANQNLPFSFSFNGAAVTQYKVSSSGILTFDVATSLAAPSYTRAALPNAGIPDKSVCIWGLGGLGANDNVVSKTFGTAPNRQLWIQYSSYGYGTTVSDGTNFTYWSIVLDEGTNTIHIVDNRTGGYAGNNKVSAGVQLDNTTAYSVALSPDLLSLSGTDPSSADNSYYSFIYGTQPAYDLSVVNITTSQYQVAGNVTITGTIRNFGTQTINSLDINYTAGGGPAFTSNLTGLSIAPLATYNFSHSVPWNAVVGNTIIEAYATNLNGGNVDAVPSNDKFSKLIQVMSENVTRLPLLEIFTSSTCGPCKPGNENFHAIMDTIASSNYVTLKYQQDFPSTGDPYASSETVNRRSSYYGINSIPRMEVDGGWDGNANSYTYGLYTAAKAIPAQFKMNGTFNLNNTTFSTKVRFSPLINTTGLNAKLYVAILENKTVKNVKSNGELEFTQVVKKMLPNENGTNLPVLYTGIWDSISASYTFNGAYRLPLDGQAANRINLATEHSVENFYNTSVVAWIQGPNKQVYQACHLSSLLPTDNQSLENNINTVQIYPNPASSELTIKYELATSNQIMYTLVDGMGNVVKAASVKGTMGVNTIQVDCTPLTSGMYNLMMFDERGNSHVEKVIIRK